MKKIAILACCVGFLVTSAPQAANEVLAWIANGFGSTCLTNLQNSHGGVYPKDVLTHIGIQYWAPTSGGGVQNLADPTSLVNWAHQNNIKALLTVYNAAGGSWDWGLASAAFGTNNTFATALVNEMNRCNLDGIDLDLEGNNLAKDSNREAFKTFVTTLSGKLKPAGKLLTVCVFGDAQDNTNENNCPNPDWYPDWTGKVDYIHVMLYGEGGDKSLEGMVPDDDQYWYSTQQKFGLDAGFSTSAISMGLPAYDDGNWQSNWSTHLNQCYDIASSVCIWDMQLRNGTWQTSGELWNKLKSFRNVTPMFKLTLSPSAGGTITANPNAASYAPGTQVTLTATPNSGYTFAGWGGALSGTTNPSSVTMNAAKTVSATFTQSGGSTFDMFAKASWDTAYDVYGSKITKTANAQSISVDWTLAKMPSDTSYPWVTLSATVAGTKAGDFAPMTAVKLTYTATQPVIISLNQTDLASDGESYMVILPVSSTAKTMTLTVDNTTFKQPEWVETPRALNMAKVLGLDFTPGVDGSTTSAMSGAFTITECTLYGVSFNTATVTPAVAAVSPKMTVRATANNLIVSGLHTSAAVTVYDISGRLLVPSMKVSPDNTGTANLQVHGLASQTTFVRVDEGTKVTTLRVPF